MRLKLVIAALIGLLISLQVGMVLADSPSDVSMLGNASIDNSTRQARLLLSADSTDGSGWHLETTLVPSASRGRSSNDTISLSGSFTLLGPGGVAVTGQALGQLDQEGRGSLQLTGQDQPVNLDASFSVSGAEQFQVNLTGTFPPTPAATNPSPSAQPVNHTFWYLSRATGLTAYVLLFLDVSVGLAASGRFLSSLLARWQAFDLHQLTGLLTVAFVLLHMFALLGDRYIGFDVVQLFVPFASPYRALWTATGVIGLYMLLAVSVSYYLRRRIGQGAWKSLHGISFALFILVFIHSVLTGTDTGEPWAVLLYWGTGVAFVMLLALRLGNTGTKTLTQGATGDSAQ